MSGAAGGTESGTESGPVCGPDGAERRLRITLPDARDTEALASLLRAIGATDVTSAASPAGGRAGVLEARFGPDEPRYLEDRIETFLHNFDPRGRGRVETAAGEGAWQEGWRAIYRGVVCAGFHVRPPWVAARDDLLDVVVDPRGGFGSGQHPTTEVALRGLGALADGRAGAAPTPGAATLDVGAGTGVLSVAAARRGLEVTAIEIEARARERCAQAAVVNGVRIRVLDDRIEDVARRERFAVALANLDPQAVFVLAGALAETLAPGGALVLAGFRAEEADRVRAAYPTLDEAARVLSADRAWSALILRRGWNNEPLS